MSQPHKKARPQKKRQGLLKLNRRQKYCIGIGIGLLVTGYWCLSIGPTDGLWSRTIAPLLLTPAYGICFPAAILLRNKPVSA